MKDWKKTSVYKNASISEALTTLEKTGSKIILVVDEMDHLLGVITDGDIRSGLLKGIDLDQPVHKIYNTSPTVAHEHDDLPFIHSIMKNKGINQIPVLNDNKKVVRLELLKEILKHQRLNNTIVLMAGGKGSRLRPLTENCPKPLLKINGKPVLEIIIKKMIGYGFFKFYISVNYKSEMIEDYFGDGSKWNISINYLREKERSGTAGSLTLLPKPVEKSIIVMNADLLTTVNMSQLLDYHSQNNASATICVRKYEFQIPFGVVNVDNETLISIEEKPLKDFFVNAGIYVLEPGVLEFIPFSTYYDMPDLLNVLLKNKRKVAVFPIGEYWLDIGRKHDFDKANEEYYQFF